MHECFLFNFTNSCNICLVDSMLNILQSKNRFFYVSKLDLFNMYQPFSNTFAWEDKLWDKRLFRNIHTHNATGRKTTQESYPRDRRKKLFSSFSGFFPLFCIMNTSSSHKNPFNNRTVTKPLS